MKRLNLINYLIVAVILSIAVSCTTKMETESPKSLTVSEGFTNPIGFYDDEPTFSWKLPTSVQAQSAYSIVVASSPELLLNKADLWQSGKVESDQNLYVNYDGEKLSSRQKVYWQVKFWDNEDNESAWSETAFLELGLLNNNDWEAKWISLPNEKAVEVPEIGKKVHKVQYLRKNIKLQNEIENARLYITAKGIFQAHINGKQVGNHALTPGWTSYQKRIETLSYDVSSLLGKGENTLGVELAEALAEIVHKQITIPIIMI